ncbi:glucans biosynthesis glucosyltransferase MdoH [Devosia sp. PTR5]|uniref:Glucans biosynthesis glucosyltransferase H n=1 Tax=Devosia oryzisoli TaxID=2774138 RepID=A0A927FQ22_9HYPH|nr:glucans biosynthesis glucosyltransferase MdoH [Devosia oryzisoli]MBD8064160.1 glucans biosynthesis glucosyltransferase MdoH [Devosia oryzisoli]
MTPSGTTGVVWLRIVLLTLAGAASLAAGLVFLDLIGGNRPSGLDIVRALLLTLTGFWLVWGGLAGLIGAFIPGGRFRRTLQRPQGKTVVLIPVYNENPIETFSRIAAMNRQVVDKGLADLFHFAILSDTTSLEVATQEAVAFERLAQEREAAGRIFYRRREINTGKKAGNIEDFVARSGGAYDYAVILDADSLMEADTLAAMALRMDADPELGLLQTVPVVIGAGSVFGRMMAFSSAYLSPYFARGGALLQGNEGPYWGHNAIIRLRAFAACCGLPVLSGRPPYGGHILSHDYVEAALLARGGWKVGVAPDLGGSYEEGPENLIEYAKRDRRWCQGNLQHRRLLNAPGLKAWSRFTLLQGIMAYLASPLWLLLVITSVFAGIFPDRGGDRWGATPWLIGAGVIATLLIPKLAILLRGIFDGHNRRFGSSGQVVLSVIAEVVLSTILAPVLLAMQTRAVVQILLGLDGGWPATARDAAAVSVRTAFAASWWIVLLAFGTIGFLSLAAPAYLPWLLPVAIPATLAPFTIALTSLGDGRIARNWVFTMPSEIAPSPVILESRRILDSWRTTGQIAVTEPLLGVTHARA